MAGDRPAVDGGAVDIGITTLILSPRRKTRDPGLEIVARVFGSAMSRTRDGERCQVLSRSRGGVRDVRRLVVLAVAVLVLGGAVLGVALAVTAGSHPLRSQSAGASFEAKTMGSIPPCADRNHVIGYVVAEPSPSAATRSMSGGNTEFLDVGSKDPSDILAFGMSGSPASLPGPSGAVMMLDSNPSLQSCYYLFSNKPAARPLIASAEAALSSTGLVTASVAEHPDAVAMTQYPLAPADTLVTIWIQGPVIKKPGVPANVILHSTLAYGVVEVSATRKALFAGPVPW